MSFVFENLDPRTRELMLKEIDFDIAHGGLYLSKRFTAHGSEKWESLLRATCLSGDEETLEKSLGVPGGAHLNVTEPSSNSSTVQRGSQSMLGL